MFRVKTQTKHIEHTNTSRQQKKKGKKKPHTHRESGRIKRRRGEGMGIVEQNDGGRERKGDRE